MADERLNPAQWEDLSAWLDGQLPPAEAERVERLVADAPAWQRAARQLRAAEAALEAYQAPTPAADLPERILRGVAAAERRRRRWVWAGRVAAPLAAAAAILLAVLLWYPAQTTTPAEPGSPPALAAGEGPALPGQQKVDQVLQGIRQEDRFVVENLDFFEDYDVVANFEVLQAIDRLEGRRQVR